MPIQDDPVSARSARPRRTRGGRRSGDSGTRDAVLRAARERFARDGYAGTTIRAIATMAGVDPALVIHFFGSKDALFAACIEFPQDYNELIRQMLAGDKETVGERLTRFYFEMWEDAKTGESLLAMLRSIASNQDAATMAHELISSQLVARLVEADEYDHPELRFTLASGQLFGVMFARHVVEVDPLAAVPLDDLVQQVAPSVQRYLTGEL